MNTLARIICLHPGVQIGKEDLICLWYPVMDYHLIHRRADTQPVSLFLHAVETIITHPSFKVILPVPKQKYEEKQGEFTN